METFAPSADSSGAEDIMLLLSWNVKFHPPDLTIDKSGSLIDKIKSAGPDIVTLQEVTHGHAADWVKHLAKIKLNCSYLSGEDVWKGKNVPAKWYQCLIASHCKVKAADIGWRRWAPYPELLARATVSVGHERDVDVFSAHIPNGWGYGWKKIDTFHVLAAALRRASDSPRILTGDFNEPKLFRTSGQIVTFGDHVHGDGGTSTFHWRDPLSASRPPIGWRNGVLSVLGGTSQHGLRDAYRALHGFERPTPVTHCTTHGNPRCFDHMFVSRHFTVVKCDYHHQWRKQGFSDHSPMWAELRLRRDLPEFEQWADDCS